MDFFNANFKKQQESITNQISNTVENINHNLDLEGLINLRKLYANTPSLVILRNKIIKLREVCRKTAIDL